jgi:hypothetical protein
LTAEKKTRPKMPEPHIMYDEEDDNIFFVKSIEVDGHEAAVDLSLVVDVKNTGDEDSMEYLYTVFLEKDEIKELQKWLKKALQYIEYVEEHGAPIPLILGVEDADGNVESI